MNLLAIETATPACAVGLATSSGLLEVLIADDERHHTESLSPGVRELLDRAGIEPRAIDRVIVDRGPGLFTGLRVGIATAVAFSLATNADLVEVTSLELLAHGAHRGGVRGPLVACVDARRGEVFVQAFDLGASVRALDEPSVARPEGVAASWVGEEVAFTGDGYVRYEAIFAEVREATHFLQLVPPPREALAIGETREGVEDVLPLYLREADAVANFQTRERPR